MMQDDAEASPEETEEVLPDSSAPKRRNSLDEQLARVVEDAKVEVEDAEVEVEGAKVEVVEIPEEGQEKDEKPEARFCLRKFCF